LYCHLFSSLLVVVENGTHQPGDDTSQLEHEILRLQSDVDTLRDKNNV